MSVVKFYAHGAECKECIRVRNFLSDHDVEFMEYDVDRSSKALEELVELTGSATHVPVMAVEGETFIDFNEEIASRILELTHVGQ